tara:strand:- start:991 stop:1425 length:435 start_codon:yes stop_codon:yes gene_type:complete
MSQLKISELFETTNKKNLMRLEIYDDVLVKCHRRIKYNSTLERTYCFFQIPEFIFGVPLYKVEEMRIYIINSLKKDGLQVMYINPNWLFISWSNSGMKKLVNSTTTNKLNKKLNQTQYKSTDNYKPTGSLIYDEQTMIGLSKFK